MTKEQLASLRVGVLGQGEPAAALTRLAGLVAPNRAAPALRLVVADSSAYPGWPVHRVAGTASPAADTLSLDGDAENPAAAAAAAAKIVVRNCDILLVLGDAGKEPLAGFVAQATSLSVPVLWLSDGQPVRLLLDPGWQVARVPAPEDEAAWDGLRACIAALLDPPQGEEAEEAALPSRFLWHLHRHTMDLIWRNPAKSESAGAPPLYWADLYATADRLANGYGDRYRSSYTIVLALAAVALTAAVLGLGLPHGESGPSPYWTALPEAGCLVAIIVLVQANERYEWRSRMIACRLMAELCRKQAALSFLARSLPVARIARMTQAGDLGWVGWRFAGAVRAAPLPTGTLAGDSLAHARDAAAALLLRGQRDYHGARAEAGRRRGARLVRVGALAFLGTVVCVAIKLGLLIADSEWAETVGLVAALLPALAAAPFGLRAYAELELLVQESERMVALLDATAASLDRTDPSRPLASQYIGDVLEDTANAMLAEVDGWIAISRVKAVEAG
jgi:hypothetical protein